MYKVVFLIDGFNLYHSLTNRFKKYKWLDLNKLCTMFLLPQEKLIQIYYFSAICTWNNDKAKRHKVYIRALENTGIKAVLGKFKKVKRSCRLCNRQYETYEEKRTDVSIGIKLLSLAYQDAFDKAYIVSADSDLVPAIEEVNTLFPPKKIVPVFPYGKRSLELTSLCKESRKIKEKQLKSSLFARQIHLADNSVITCPAEWI